MWNVFRPVYLTQVQPVSKLVLSFTKLVERCTFFFFLFLFLETRLRERRDIPARFITDFVTRGSTYVP